MLFAVSTLIGQTNHQQTGRQEAKMGAICTAKLEKDGGGDSLSCEISVLREVRLGTNQ